MMKIYNSEFEVSMRVLLLLNVFQKPLNIDEILAIDILSTYGKQYGILNINLHGDNSYTTSELTIRRELISKALKKLVVDSFAIARPFKEGFHFAISEIGSDICIKMKSDYAYEYLECLQRTKDFVSKKDSQEIKKMIYREIKRRD